MNQRDDFSHELISAFLDGEVSPDERARVEQLVASSDEHRQVLEDMRAVTSCMQRLPSYHLDDAFAQRVSAIARQTGMAHETDAARLAQCAPAATVWYWPAVVGLTATAAAAVVIAFLFGSAGTDSADFAGSQMVAQVPASPSNSTREAPTASADVPFVTTPDRDNVGPSAMTPLVDHQLSSLEARSTSGTDVPADLPPSSQPTISSDAATIGKAVAPPSNVVAVEPATSQPLPAPSRVRDAAAPVNGDRPPTPRQPLNDLPLSGTQQLLLVIDVALTQQGAEQDAFEQDAFQRGAFQRVLAAHQIAVGDTVPFDPKLEEALLASRFFEPRKTPPGSEPAARTDMALVYVNTRAGHVDEICREMRLKTGEFAAITFDMAWLTKDQALFQKLQQAVQQQAANAPPNAEAKLRERRPAAHRLALSPNWRGTPAQELKGVEGLLGMDPDRMLGGDAAKTPPIDSIPGQPPPQVPLPPGGRLGENIDADILFIVHVSRGTQE